MASRKDGSSFFNQEIASIRPVLSQPETEESWDAISNSITRLGDVCKTSACDSSADVISSVRSLSRPIILAMGSERTRLSGNAIGFISVLATSLGPSFDPLLPIFFPPLLAICARTNKVFITRARTCILTIIETTQLPSILSHLALSLQDKAVSLRLTAMESILACLNCFNPPDIEKEARALDIENAIRATARDANADVRRTSRRVFEAYKVLLPGRIESFAGPLSPTMKKYLDIPVKPPTSGSTSLTHSLSQLTRAKSQSKRAAAPPASASSASLGPPASRSAEDVATGVAIPEITRSKDESHKRTRARKAVAGGMERGTVPSSDMDLLRRSQPSPASMAGAIRQRTKSAPSNPSAALRAVSAALPLPQDSHSTLIRPLIQQADLARRQQPSVAASATLGAPSQPQRPRSVHVQRLVDGDDAALNGPRRIPIAEALAAKIDKEVSRPQVWPASRVDNVLATSTSKAQSKSSKAVVSNPTVGTKEDKELAKLSTKPVSRPEMTSSTSAAKSQANNVSSHSTSSTKEESGAQHTKPVSHTDNVTATSSTKSRVGSVPTNPHAATKEESGKQDSRPKPNVNVANTAPVFKPKSSGSRDDRDPIAPNKDGAESAKLQTSRSNTEAASTTSTSRPQVSSFPSSANLTTKETKESAKEQARSMSGAEAANATSTSKSQVNSLSSSANLAMKGAKESAKEQQTSLTEVANTTSTSRSQVGNLSSSANLATKETKEPAKEQTRPMSRAEVSNTMSTSKHQTGSSRVTAVKGSGRQAQRPMSRAEFRSTVPTSKPQANVPAHKKGKEISQQERGLRRMRSTPALSSSTTRKAKPTEPLVIKSNSGPRGDGTRGTDSTKPTFAQLAHIKPRAEKKAESSKPIWGRLLPRKVLNTKAKSGSESPQAEQAPPLSAKSVESNVSPTTSEQLPASPIPEATNVEEREGTDSAGTDSLVLTNDNEEIKDDADERPPAKSGFNMTPRRVMGPDEANKDPMQTPISSLLTSIENGFVVTPLGPLSPPQAYIGYPTQAMTAFGMGRPREIPPEEREALEAVAKGPLGFGLPKWAMNQNRQVLSDVENF